MAGKSAAIAGILQGLHPDITGSQSQELMFRQKQHWLADAIPITLDAQIDLIMIGWRRGPDKEQS